MWGILSTSFRRKRVKFFFHMKKFFKALPLVALVLLSLFGLQSCDSIGDAPQNFALAQAGNQTGAQAAHTNVTTVTLPLDSIIEWKVKVRTAELEIRTARAEAKVEAYDNLIATGWIPSSTVETFVASGWIKADQCCCNNKSTSRSTSYSGNGGTRTGTLSNDFGSKGIPAISIPSDVYYDPQPLTTTLNYDWLAWLLAWDRNNCNTDEYNYTSEVTRYPVKPADTATAQVPDTTTKFTSVFGINVIPSSEVVLGSAGLQFRLTDKLFANAGVSAGYRRIPQSHTETVQAVDVKTGTHTFVGATVGASYQLTDKFSVFASGTGWGKDSDDYLFTVGGAFHVKQNVDIGISFNFGEEIKGLGLNLQF